VKGRRETAAGLWLSALAVKPQFLPVLVAYLLWARQWRTLRWFAVGTLIWLSVTIALAGGTEGIRAYVTMIEGMASPKQAHTGVIDMISFRAYALLALEAEHAAAATTIVVSIVALALTCWLFTRHKTRVLTPALLLTIVSCALLIGYDTQIYSAALLVPPALALLASSALSTEEIPPLTSISVDFTLLAPSVIWAGALLVPDHAGVAWFLAKLALFVGVVALFAIGIGSKDQLTSEQFALKVRGAG
jgi:hypothetical protein